MYLRNIRYGDSEKIIKLIEKSGGTYVYPYNTYVYWMLENYHSSTCFVVEQDDEFIGFISGISTVSKSIVFLWQICVSYNYRNKGIGTLLLESFIEKIQKLNIKYLEFTISLDNEPSINLFKTYADRKNIKMIEKKIEDFNSNSEIVYQYQL